MSNGTGGKGTSKYKENKQALTKETNTLDNKHREMVRHFSQQRNDKQAIHDKINQLEKLDIINVDSINEYITKTPQERCPKLWDAIIKKTEFIEEKKKARGSNNYAQYY